MVTSSRCLLLSQSEELSSLDMHSVPRVKSYLTSSFGRFQQGEKLTFPDTISRDTSQIRLFGAKVTVKSRPRPQDNDDDDRGGGGCRTEAHT